MPPYAIPRRHRLRPLAVLGSALLLFLFLPGHHIGAGEPAVQIDVGAALAAKRPELVHDRLAADGTGAVRRISAGSDIAFRYGDWLRARQAPRLQRPPPLTSHGIEPARADREAL